MQSQNRRKTKKRERKLEKKLDIFGVLAIAATSALGGGIIRDVLLGLAPPATFTDARYLFVPLVCGVFVFYVHPAVARLHKPLIVLDAAGLGLFAVAGAKKALDAGLNAPASVGIGMGQVNRVDSARLAVSRAGDRVEGSVAASDAFFPFADGLQILIDAGVSAVVQPGGSVRDEEVIAAAKAAGIAMFFTGTRHFSHA